LGGGGGGGGDIGFERGGGSFNFTFPCIRKRKGRANLSFLLDIGGEEGNSSLLDEGNSGISSSSCQGEKEKKAGDLSPLPTVKRKTPPAGRGGREALSLLTVCS